ncbi:matrilin-2-like [Dendronephthya gigantea]|uniref:matrilin-2-like n=1 Tax=Dendronephthya gigantea TaxID=151771 RepID=UPI00106B7FEA|nr:matrilin-2-like [Dendronephthya gigantea]
MNCLLEKYECYECHKQASCINTNGTLHCSCNNGFTGNGSSCTDVNECEIGTNNCNGNASCNNTIGSFNCVCNIGFVGDGTTCEEITICPKRIDLGFILDSSGSIGRYSFDQTKSFVKDLTKFFTISQNSTRVSVMSYATGATLHFRFSRVFGTRQNLYSAIDNIPYSGGGTNTHLALLRAYTDMFNAKNGSRVTDVNECEIGTNNCNSNASCNNTIGSFRCACNVGYVGDGIKCRNLTICAKKIDLGFVMDSSSSIGHYNFNQTKLFIKDFTDYFKISENGTRVSVITYATWPTLQFGFSRKFTTRQDLYSEIDNIPYTGYWGADTERALTKAYIDMFDTQNGARISGIKRILIVFTDGRSSGNVYYPSQQLKNMGVVIFSIGVGSGIDVLQLETMASSPAKDHVFLLRNFSEFAHLAHNISFIACNGITTNITRDSCGNTHLYTPGRLTSPRYPYEYPRQLNCSWIISSTNATYVSLQFSVFSLEGGSSCQYDYLDVYDGNSIYAKKLGRFCGQQSPRKLVSSGSTLFVVFHTDSIIQKQGFVLNYTDTNDSDSCGNFYLYTPGRLTSPLHPYYYPRNTDCTWIISSTSAANVLLQFSFFSLEYSSSCQYDYLDVYDGNSMYARKLGRFCGQQLPRKLWSSGSKLFIVFHTDGGVQKQGFVLNYTSTTDSDSCGNSYLYTPGRLTSPRYPYNYPRNTDCTWNISSNNATNVLLKFSFFWLEGGSSCRYDYLDVYDGNSMYAKKLGRFCGQQFPRKLVSSGSKLFIVFHTDGSDQEQGFVLDYTSTIGIKRILIVFTDGKSSGNVYYPSQQLKDMGVIIFSIGVGSGIDVLELKTMASSPAKDHVFLLHNFNQFAHLAHNMSFNACNASTTPHLNTASCGNIYLYTPGILTSPFYPNDYLSNTNCTWIISSTNGTYVLLQFSFFSLEGGSSCPYDYLDVYDGNSMYAKKLGRFCGQQLPRKLVSSGSKLLILFHTDSSIQKQGFVLNYTDTNDTNKCSGAPCAPYANCTKINGSYVCVCKPGYIGNGTSCTDIDECNGPNNCSPNAVCHNVVGSYTCDCSHGYHGDGTRCDDIDECRDQPQKCTGAGESCTNYPGRYRCGCISSGQQFIDNKCTDIQASVQGEFRIINRKYIPAFNNKNSAEYFEFTEMLINELTSLYRRTPKIHSTFRLIIILRLL